MTSFTLAGLINSFINMMMMTTFVLFLTAITYLIITPAYILCSDNGLAPTPPMGWLSCFLHCPSSQEDCDRNADRCIRESLYYDMADHLVKDGYQEAGYTFVNIDDCWMQRERDPITHEMIVNKQFFSKGVKNLAKYVHVRGLKLGIYSDIGTATCLGNPGHVNEEGKTPADFFSLDAKLIASLNADSLKVDGCHMKPENMDPLYGKLSHALNETGRPIIYYCSGPFFQARWGTPNYPADKVNWDHYRKHCNGWRFFDDILLSWQSILSVIDFYSENVHIYEKFQGPGNWFDPDQLIIGQPGITLEQGKSQFALWAMMSAPLLISRDLRLMKQEEKDILLNRHIIAIDQDPLGVMGKPVIVNGVESVWVKRLSHQDSYAVVYFNRGGEPAGMNYTIRSFIRGANALYEALDLFDDAKSLGTFKPDDGIQLSVPTTGVRMFKLVPVRQIYL